MVGCTGGGQSPVQAVVAEEVGERPACHELRSTSTTDQPVRRNGLCYTHTSCTFENYNKQPHPHKMQALSIVLANIID